MVTRPDDPAGPPGSSGPIAFAGLCAGCDHALVRPTRRGTTYLRCARASTDSRFARYPRLPVRECPGYEPRRPPHPEAP